MPNHPTAKCMGWLIGPLYPKHLLLGVLGLPEHCNPQLYQVVSKLTGLEKRHPDNNSYNITVLLDTTAPCLITTYIWYVLTMSDLYNKDIFLRHRHSNTSHHCYDDFKTIITDKIWKQLKAERKRSTSFPI